jgi:hypothetical protein
MGFEITYGDTLSLTKKAGLPGAQGEVFFLLEEASTGEVLFKDHRKNLITLDASILAAMLFRDPDSRNFGANMLAVGTGATGALLSPDAPDPKQRRLNAEIARKPWSSTVFRDGSGNAVAIPTNIVDFTCTFDEGEAVGPLNEMGIFSTESGNPLVLNLNPNIFPIRDTTVDVSSLDILMNYLSFSVLSKPATARLTITWRITF